MGYNTPKQLFKFIKRDYLKYYQDLGLLRFSSNHYFGREFFKSFGDNSNKLDDRINDPVEALDINYVDHHEGPNGLLVRDSVETYQKPTFFMFSMFGGSIDEGRQIFCENKLSNPLVYDACIEFNDINGLMNGIILSDAFFLPDSDQARPCSSFFDELRIGKVHYERFKGRPWGSTPPPFNPFIKRDTHLDQNEHRIVLPAKLPISLDAILVKVTDLSSFIGKVHFF